MITKADVNWIYLNGRLVTRQEAVVSVYDRGFLYGDGVFETLRAYQGKIFKPRDHLTRLFRSAEGISLPISFSRDELLNALSETLKANHLKDAYLRITVSRGPGEPGLEFPVPSNPTLVVISKAFAGYPEKLYREGVAVTVVRLRKAPTSSLNPKVKSLNYLPQVLAKREATGLGAYEGILLDQDGFLSEGTASNLFLVKQEQLLTPGPSCAILEGITRQCVLELAEKAGFSVKEGKYRPEELLKVDECFLTNTTMEVMPVVKYIGQPAGPGDHAIHRGQVGPVTCQLRKAYQELVREK
jgi:branched-chain amino acid aminotransferase